MKLFCELKICREKRINQWKSINVRMIIKFKLRFHIIYLQMKQLSFCCSVFERQYFICSSVLSKCICFSELHLKAFYFLRKIHVLFENRLRSLSITFFGRWMDVLDISFIDFITNDHYSEFWQLFQFLD